MNGFSANFAKLLTEFLPDAEKSMTQYQELEFVTLEKLLTDKISQCFLDQNMDYLMQYCYRLDLPEEQVTFYLRQKNALKLAQLMLMRERQKYARNS